MKGTIVEVNEAKTKQQQPNEKPPTIVLSLCLQK